MPNCGVQINRRDSRMADEREGRPRSESRTRDRGSDRPSGEAGGDRDRERDREPDREGAEPASLLVRNISYRVRAEDLKQLFNRYGEVRDVYIPQVRKFFVVHFRIALIFKSFALVFAGFLQQKASWVCFH